MAKWRDVKQNRTQKYNDSTTQGETLSPCASLWTRFKAFAIDAFIITTPITYIVMYMILGGGDEFSQNRISGWTMILGVTAIIVLSLWYFKAQTPGMKAYEIKIVHAKTKERISIFQAMIRYVATFFAMVSFFLMFLPFFNKEKKTFQDLVSNTIIIDE